MSDYAKGLLYGFSAFVIWGLAPIYWKLIDQVSAYEVTSHRILWSAVLLLVYLVFKKRAIEIKELFFNKQKMLWIVPTAFLIGGNWFTFIYAIRTERILETSLGYYFNPLLSVFLGFLFLNERMSRVQLLAVLFAFLGFSVQVLLQGYLPWISIALAASFAFYGLIRKITPVKPLVGLCMEAILLSPICLMYLAQENRWQNFFIDSATAFLLVLAGAITLAPLLFFLEAVKRLELSTVGFLQFTGPSLSFLTAIFIYNEEFNSTKLTSFLLIWMGVIFYIASLKKKKA